MPHYSIWVPRKVTGNELRGALSIFDGQQGIEFCGYQTAHLIPVGEHYRAQGLLEAPPEDSEEVIFAVRRGLLHPRRGAPGRIGVVLPGTRAQNDIIVHTDTPVGDDYLRKLQQGMTRALNAMPEEKDFFAPTIEFLRPVYLSHFDRHIESYYSNNFGGLTYQFNGNVGYDGNEWASIGCIGAYVANIYLSNGKGWYFPLNRISSIRHGGRIVWHNRGISTA
ncbi:MAG: hypothetical protein HY365_03505 [Candidatus Aenigmarchaeota archaeon]|nr:hypothetical protein [Candidatus Aenigmarchaeota archaeon]